MPLTMGATTLAKVRPAAAHTDHYALCVHCFCLSSDSHIFFHGGVTFEDFSHKIIMLFLIHVELKNVKRSALWTYYKLFKI